MNFLHVYLSAPIVLMFFYLSSSSMEYEVFYGCNIVGTIVVFLIIAYHLIAAKSAKTLDDDLPTKEVPSGIKKSQ